MSPQVHYPHSHAALYVPAAVAAAGVALDPAQTTPSISLSGGNLIATTIGTLPSSSSSRATISGSNLRHYCEATITAATADTYFGLGLADSTHVMSEANFLGDATSACAYVANQTYLAGANEGAWTVAGSVGSPRIIQMATDLKIPRKAWWKLDTDTGWNAGSTSAPNASGAYDISFLTGNVYPAIDFQTGSEPAVLTMNFGAIPYVGTMPLGYTHWGSLEPPPTAIWDGATTTSNVDLPTLTTASVSGTPTDNEAVRVTTSHPMVISKWYGKFQVTLTGGIIGVGVVDNSFPMGGNSLGSDTHSIVALTNGNIVFANANIGTWTSATPATGDTIELCIDVTPTGVSVFARLNTGNWNNSGSADPATGAGGLAGGLGGLIYLTATFRNSSSGSSLQLIDGNPPGGGFCHW